jgi:hypothetical protein
MERDVYRRGDASSDKVVIPISRCVRKVAHHDSPECLLAELSTLLDWYLCKDYASDDPKTRNVDAFGKLIVKRVRGTPPKGPTTRLKVRLRR